MAYLTWDSEQNYHKWSNLAQYWELVELLYTGTDIDSQKVDKLDKKKKKKLVRLIMHMNDIKVYDEEKEIKNLKHKIEDIKLIAEEIKKHVQIIHG